MTFPAAAWPPPPTGSGNAANKAAARLESLDILRGTAVMGILAMNIVAFAMPLQAYLNFAAYGERTTADLVAWAASYILIDGKMRAMFSMLYGASMLLIIERAERQGQDGASIHIRRSLWLLLFGLIHFFLIWHGDILVGYALTGLAAWFFVGSEPRQLFRWSLVLLGIGLLVFATLFGSILWLEYSAAATGAPADVVSEWRSTIAELGRPTAAMIAEDLARYRGPYAGIVAWQFGSNWLRPLRSALIYFPETLSFMLLGMAGLKSGFLTGSWRPATYRKIALLGLAVGAAGYAALAWLTVRSGFDTGLTLFLQNVAGAPLRPVMMVGYVALIMLMLERHGGGWLRRRIAAAGQAAFTNYLGTSIAATAIFYGFGLGLYGRLGRAELYMVAAALCLVMLLWSKPWLDRYRYGPLEYLWRSLARGERQPMRR